MPWGSGGGGRSGTPQGGTRAPGGSTRTPLGGYPDPPSWGGTWSGTPPPPRPGQKEYSLHGGRYASCVHAGGLSCNDVLWHYNRAKKYMSNGSQELPPCTDGKIAGEITIKFQKRPTRTVKGYQFSLDPMNFANILVMGCVRIPTFLY